MTCESSNTHTPGGYNSIPHRTMAHRGHDPLLDVPRRNARVQLVRMIVLWLQAGSTCAFTVQPLKLLPGLTARSVSESSTFTLACKAFQEGSDAPKTHPSSTVFGADASHSLSLSSAPLNRQPQQEHGPAAQTFAGADFLTLYQLGKLFADVRERYHNTSTNVTTLPQETVLRNLQRLDNLPINRCTVGP
eukprot:3767969-Rhodomonas_salina.1